MNLERQAEQVDEAGGVGLIIDVILAERRNFLAVEGIGRFDSGRNTVAFIQLHAYSARHVLLCAVHKSGESLAQGGVPETVVYQLSKFGLDTPCL